MGVVTIATTDCWNCASAFGESIAAVLFGAIVETSQQHAPLIDVSGAWSCCFALVGQQQDERTLPSMLQWYATRANAAEGSRTAIINRESTTRRTSDSTVCRIRAFRNAVSVIDAVAAHGATDAGFHAMMDMDHMMGGMGIGMMLLMVLLVGAAIAALIALTVFLIRRSR